MDIQLFQARLRQRISARTGPALSEKTVSCVIYEVERLTAWLVRQTGVRLDTLKQHYARWWPRDRAAIRATYALLDRLFRANGHRTWCQIPKPLDYTANRKCTMSRRRP